MMSKGSCRVTWQRLLPSLAVLLLVPACGQSVEATAAQAGTTPASKPTAQDVTAPGDTDTKSIPAYLFEGPPMTGERAKRVVQGEALVHAGHVHARGGSVSAQEMSSFGSGWQGDAQLFFAAGSKSARLVLELYAIGPAWYSVDVYLTRAPDYGRLALTLEGSGSSTEFDGYAPQVEPARVLHVGSARPDQGPLILDVHVTGRNRKSRGYFAGIDRIVLTPRRGPP